MDDMTTFTTTMPCTRQLLIKLQENIEWARMKIKPSKSRSISVVKGKLSEQRFFIGEEPIPTVSEKPVKSLGHWYDANLKDKVRVDHLRQDTICSLESIDKSLLPGRLKLWCLQFGLLSRLMGPLTIYEVPISKVEKSGWVVCQKVAGSSQQNRAVWKRYSGAACVQSFRGIQVLQSKAGNDTNKMTHV